MHSYAKTGLLAIVLGLWLGYVESLVTVRRLSVTGLGGRRRLKSGLAHLPLQGIALNYLVPPMLPKTYKTIGFFRFLESPQSHHLGSI